MFFFGHFSVSLQIERIILRQIEHFCIRQRRDGTYMACTTLLIVNGKSVGRVVLMVLALKSKNKNNIYGTELEI